MKKITLFIIAFLMGSSPYLVLAETVSLSTYYPAPFGMYDRLRLVPRNPLVGVCKVGTMYTENITNTLQYCAENGGGPNAGNWGSMGGLWEMDATNNVFLIGSDTIQTMRVGIGDTHPDAFLEVSRNGTTIDPFMVSSNDDFDGDLFSITYGGNVGIGVENPQHKLHIVEGNTGVSQLIESTTSDYVTIRLRSDDSRRKLIAEDGSGNTESQIRLGDDGLISFFGPSEASDLRMRIQANNDIYIPGSLGVGTTGPGQRIHIVGAGGTAAIIENTDNDYAEIRLRSEDSRRKLVALDSNNNVESQIRLGDDGRISFFGPSEASDLRMRIQANDDIHIPGRLGIGTASPNSDLDVNGGVKIGYTGANCNNASKEGITRYNSTTKVLEFCNGTAWAPIGAGWQQGMYCGFAIVGGSNGLAPGPFKIPCMGNTLFATGEAGEAAALGNQGPCPAGFTFVRWGDDGIYVNTCVRN